MKDTKQSIVKEFQQVLSDAYFDAPSEHDLRLAWITKKSEQFLLQALSKVEQETREETLQGLKDYYEQVQQDLDKEYQDNNYCPNYMGILEEKLEKLKQSNKAVVNSSDEVVNKVVNKSEECNCHYKGTCKDNPDEACKHCNGAEL